MTKTSNTIVFFGSGPVAAKSLALLQQSFNIEAVITKPATEAEMTTVAHETPVYSVANKQELDDLITRQRFQSTVGVLIDFGIIVSQKVIDYFPLGIVNSHFSLLPQWRGADPITFSLLSGQSETGVSLMLLVAAMDEGPLLGQRPLTIASDDTSSSLTDKLIRLSYQMLAESLPPYLEGSLAPYTQSTEGISYSRKITKEDSLLDWTKPAEQLEREIRAYNQWPKSRTELAGKEVIITQAHLQTGSGTPGALWREGKKIGLCTARDILVIDKLKPAGKPEMTAEAFLNGYGNDL